MAEKTTSRTTTEIKPCTCQNEYQDKMYGKGMRVKNSCKKGAAWRCTSCRSVM